MESDSYKNGNGNGDGKYSTPRRRAGWSDESLAQIQSPALRV